MSEQIRFTPYFFKKYVAGQQGRVADLLATRPPGKSLYKELSSIFPKATRAEISTAINGKRRNWRSPQPNILLPLRRFPATLA